VTPSAPAATTTPAARLATTGANVEWLMVAGLLGVIAGSAFLAFSRRKRIW
jgi:LPXTG-motif cell wall-anchored protein